MKPILIVDDNADTREVICEMLAYEGYAVVNAPNGRQALDLLVSGDKEAPCLIVLDLGMPVMSGWEFLESVRSYARLANIPVLVTSGTDVQSEVLKHEAVIGCLLKPVNFEKMLATIRRVTREDRPALATL
jgi:CheY-like chemotaxis protein